MEVSRKQMFVRFFCCAVVVVSFIFTDDVICKRQKHQYKKLQGNLDITKGQETGKMCSL